MKGKQFGKENPEKKVHLLDPLVFSNKTKIFDLKFNPLVENQLASVDMKGKLKILKISEEEKKIEIVKNYQVSKESVYSMDYSNDGEVILCGTFDGEIVLVQNSKVLLRKKANEGNISSVKFINENLISSGDSNGTIKVFDLRVKKEVFNFKEQTEDITEFEFSENTNLLLATSIDGSLGVYDIRKEGKGKLYALSDCIEDELYCMRIVKNGQKVACGTSEGPVVLFNWDWFGDFKDRILGHPSSVNCLEKYDENFLITGCEDGGVRFVSIYPKYIHSIISDKVKSKHITENRSFNDISSLSIDKDKKLLAVCSNINYIKLYNICDLDIQQTEGKNNFSLEEEAEDLSDEEKEFEDDFDFEEGGEISDSDESDFEKENISQSELTLDNQSGNNSDSDSDSDTYSDHSHERKTKKTDKSLKLDKSKNSDRLIEKERRKEFFNDI